MDIVIYTIVAAYLLAINILAFWIYQKSAQSPSPRIPAIIIFLPVIAGGSIGAFLANYIFQTQHKEPRSWLWAPLGFTPPISLLIQAAAFLILTKNLDLPIKLWLLVYHSWGVIGCVLLCVNIISFFFVAIRTAAYYIAPSGNKLIPDFLMIPFLLLGGAPGATFSKIMFNFSEDWRFDCTKQLQNFLYNNGMFLICAIQIALFVYAGFAIQ